MVSTYRGPRLILLISQGKCFGYINHSSCIFVSAKSNAILYADGRV